MGYAGPLNQPLEKLNGSFAWDVFERLHTSCGKAFPPDAVLLIRRYDTPERLRANAIMHTMIDYSHDS